MFCPKCGAQTLEGAKFCQACGEQLIADAAAPTATQPAPAVPTWQPNSPLAGDRKKKSKKPLVILGIAVLAIVLIIASAVLGNSDPQTPPSTNSKGVNLSESYTNEAEGIAFRYPKAWISFDEERLASFAEDPESESPLVVLGNETEDLPEEDSYVMISKFAAAQEQIDHLFVSDEEFAATFDSEATIQNTSTTELDGRPARQITYITAEGIGCQSYFYAVGSTIYRIDFSWMGESSGNKQRFFDAIIGSYTITAPDLPSGTSDNSNLSNLCYQDVPLISLLDCAPVELYEHFGAPTFGTPVNGDLYDGGEYYGYEGVLFIIDYATSKVNWILGDANAVETKKGTLDKTTHEEIIRLLGTPAREEDVYDEVAETGWYNMRYLLDGAVVDIHLPDSDGKATTVIFSLDVADASSGMDWEDNDALLAQNEYSLNTDPNLYGRWRAGDGKSIEFYEGGSGNMNFCLWSKDQLGNCDWTMWQAANGHISLEPHFSYLMEYEYIPKTDSSRSDYIALPIWGKFHRVEGSDADGIVGGWSLSSSDRASLGLYADGTGYWYGHNAYYWNATDTDLEICIKLDLGFDYYVSGDMLQLFFSDGSLIFTKVGS